MPEQFKSLVVGRVVHYVPQGTGGGVLPSDVQRETHIPALVTFVHERNKPPFWLPGQSKEEFDNNVVELDIRWPKNIMTEGPFETGRAVRYGYEPGQWHWPPTQK